MNEDRATLVAVELHRLGVSHVGVVNLLTYYPLDVIERQLRYLPHRKCRRPAAFIVEAIRHDYSPPKEYFYASPQTSSAPAADAVDEDPERGCGPDYADPQ